MTSYVIKFTKFSKTGKLLVKYLKSVVFKAKAKPPPQKIELYQSFTVEKLVSIELLKPNFITLIFLLIKLFMCSIT